MINDSYTGMPMGHNRVNSSEKKIECAVVFRGKWSLVYKMENKNVSYSSMVPI